MKKNGLSNALLSPYTLLAFITGSGAGTLAGAFLSPYLPNGFSAQNGMLAGFIIGAAGSFIFVYLLNRNRTKKQTPAPKPDSKNEPLQVRASHEDVTKAVRLYSEQLPPGVYRTILIKDDYSIDFQPLIPYLGGIPDQQFYMSKETYEIFSESEKHLAPLIDQVQKAVDQYVQNHNKYPILDFDPLRRVNYFELRKEHYLKEHPDIDFYVTKYDGLLTHVKPAVKPA